MNRYTVDFVNEDDHAGATGYRIVDTMTGEADIAHGDDEEIAKRVDQRNEKWEETRQAVDDLFQVLNNVSDAPKGDIVQAARMQHRTLQQDFTKLCVKWFETLADLDENEYDLRMEASVKLAKAITQTEAWKDAKYLPLI